MKAIHQKRLLNVAKALRESPKPAAFSMENYGEDGTKGLPENSKSKKACGSPACALGHYAARLDFQRTFRLVFSWDDFPTIHAGKREVGYISDEILAHFGITEDDAEELFSGDGCGRAKSPKGAALYIERFVARKLRENSRR